MRPGRRRTRPGPPITTPTTERPTRERAAALPALLLLLLALLVAALGMGTTFGEPFGRGWLGHNGARYAQIARNYDRYGFFVLGGAPLLDAGEPPGGWRTDGPHEIYAHHPPGVPLAVAICFRILGVSEDAARLVPALAALVLLVLLARLVGHVAGAEAGGWAALAAASQPMLSVYGAHVDVQGAPVLCASIGVILLYRRWLLGRDVRPMLLVAALASSLDWYGLYAPVCCAAHAFCTRPDLRRGALLLVLFALLLFAAWWAWLAGLPGVSAEDVLSAASLRAAAGVPAGASLTPHVRHWFDATRQLMPAWPALLALAVAVLLGRAGPRPQDTAVAARPLGPRGLLVLLLLPPLFHALLFPAGLLQHGYWLFGLTPALGAAFGLAVVSWRPVLAALAAAALLLAGAQGARATLADADELPALVGRVLAEHTAPQDVTLTNYEANPFAPGSGDEHALMRPAVTFYADRILRGGIETPQALEQALVRRPDAAWFLVVPLPALPSAELLAAVAARAAGEPLKLSDQPPALLYRLAR